MAQKSAVENSSIKELSVKNSFAPFYNLVLGVDITGKLCVFVCMLYRV